MTETRKNSAPKRGADAATSARAILTAEKINRAAELRLAGLTLEEIGKELGCSKVYAHRLIKRGRDMVATKNVETLREREAAILEEARERVEEDALVNLSLQHFDRYLKVSDRVRALYGLDAPVKSQVELNANVKLQTLAEWRAELADVFRRHDAADQSEGAFKVEM